MRCIPAIALSAAVFGLLAAAQEEQKGGPLAKRQHLAQRREEADSVLAERGIAALSGLGKIFSGEGTYFYPGLNYCFGTHSGNDDMIVAASETLFNQWGGGTQSKLCNKQIKITSGGKSVYAKITDQCPAGECQPGSLDMSPAVFKKLADLNVGRLTDLKWAFVDGGSDNSSSNNDDDDDATSFKAVKPNVKQASSGGKAKHGHKAHKAKHHKAAHHSHKKAHKAHHGHKKHHKHASHKEEELEDCE
ncbi:unnamed protein product [Parajaminaea phylloscopi]